MLRPQKTILLLATVLAMSQLVAAAPRPTIDILEPESVTRVFNLQYARVTEVMTAIEPLLSEEGSLSVKIAQSQLTIQDRPEVVRRIAILIDELDQPPTEYQIRVMLLEASNDPDEPSDTFVDPRVRRMFNYSSYRKVASTVIVGKVGTAARADLGASYWISFIPRPASRREQQIRSNSSQPSVARTPWSIPGGVPGRGSQAPNKDQGKGNQPPQSKVLNPRVELRHLTLTRKLLTEGGVEKRLQVLRTHVFLTPGQEALLGAGASEQSERALILVVRAEYPGDR